MNLTIGDKLQIFILSRTAEYEGTLTHMGVATLKKIYDSCTPEEQELLETESYIVCQMIKDWSE